MSDPHELLSCPYDTAHQIERYRMQYHLEKCRKQHPNSKKVKCPFDSTHIVNDTELDYHISECPKRDMFDRQLYQIEDISEYKPSTQGAVPDVACTEDWDNDNYNSYQPDQTKKSSHIIQKIKGATPSERRKARMEGIKSYRPEQAKE